MKTVYLTLICVMFLIWSGCAYNDTIPRRTDCDMDHYRDLMKERQTYFKEWATFSAVASKCSLMFPKGLNVSLNYALLTGYSAEDYAFDVDKIVKAHKCKRDEQNVYRNFRRTISRVEKLATRQAEKDISVARVGGLDAVKTYCENYLNAAMKRYKK